MKHKLGVLILLLAALAVACGGAITGSSAGGGAGGGAGYGNSLPKQAVTKSAIAGQPAPGQATTGGGLADVVPPVPDGPRVIRSAQLAVEVKNGTFDRTIDRVFSIATQYGGYVSGSSAATDNGALREGTISFQVPSDKFTDALSAIRALGTVQNLVIGGQDVSAQYVDLQARLANEQAQRDAMLALLQRAVSIQDIINIQNQLGQITGQIEQLKGQLNYFDHATTYSTISVSLHEAAVAAQPNSDPYGLRAALDQGFRGFVGTFDYLLVAVGYAGPILVLLLLFWVAWRVRRRFAL